jgi:DNA mismatch repair protein MSH6
MDSDIGVNVLGFSHMKGLEGHSGFPESAYGKMCEQLINAGYKVARVEQTETPDQLKIRNKSSKGKNAGVVNREVCAVSTVGTRTFCYMDTDTLFADNSGGEGTGPLLAISEIMLDQPPITTTSGEASNDDAPPAVCEYGVCLIDTVRGTVTLGQFADDKLRSRLHTLLATTAPSEFVLENSASKDLRQMIKNNCPRANVESVGSLASLPPSRAIDPKIQRRQTRPGPFNPWDPAVTIREIHRKSYFPRGSKTEGQDDESRWPQILRACVEGSANLAVSALGGGIFYLQRSLVDYETMTMAEVRAYIPPISTAADVTNTANSKGNASLSQIYEENVASQDAPQDANTTAIITTDHMQLDGITLENLEILANQADGTVRGSLWGRINKAKSPHGQRLLRGWLLRPLFKKADIDRRADAVSELVSGSAAFAMSEARGKLQKIGDIERLLSRVHSMGNVEPDHPANRQVLYEGKTHTKRKVQDFSKLLKGLDIVDKIIDLFADVDVSSPFLAKIVHRTDKGGCFPLIKDQLGWFVQNFNAKKAEEGEFEPTPGMDEDYDKACANAEGALQRLDDLKRQYIEQIPGARGNFVWANTKLEQKDKYLIELPVSVKVPSSFIVKGKRGTGSKQISKYATAETEAAVKIYEQALAQKKEGRSRGIEATFRKFDDSRALWSTAVQVSAMLDALGALADVSAEPGMCRPTILDDSHKTTVNIVGGVHPCVQTTHTGGDFVPNDASLGGDAARVLLLSGPNMGGKSTLLRQTCLISIMAQLGMFVPATSCKLTPFDRIFTRLGSSDKILAGQSTFFVELSECAAALRGASARSFVIMDELGRGTSTFDGTAIAHAVIKHLVEETKCLTMFATHYHSLLEDMEGREGVMLGHMQCHVEDDSVTFLYQLADGACPESFGINVARLAALPEGVLRIAQEKSEQFETDMARAGGQDGAVPVQGALAARIKAASERGDAAELKSIWEELQ